MPEAGVGSGRFIGRPATLEALRRRLSDTLAGNGGVTLVIGDAGVGKTTLLQQFTKEVRDRGAQAFFGLSPALDEPPPFSLVRSAFSEVLGAPPSDAEVPSDRPEEIAVLEFAPLLADAGAQNPAGIEERLLRALDDTEARGRNLRERALAEFMQRVLALTEGRPTVVLLDDIDRADESSVAAIRYLARNIAQRPLWVLCTSRPFATQAAANRTRLEEFEEEVVPQLLPLPALDPSEVSEYLKSRESAPELSSEEVQHRFAESGGNPALLQQFALRRALGLRVRGIRGPGSPPLEPNAQRTLDVASILGPEFTFELLIGVKGGNEDELRAVVDDLVSQGVLLERERGRFEFRDDRSRERAYGHLNEIDRRILHQRAGEIRERMSADDPTQVFGLARDFYLGGSDEKSIRYNRIAAEIAERASSPDTARDFLAHALESQRNRPHRDLEQESALVLELARVSYELGRLEEAEWILRNFLDLGRDEPMLAPRVRSSLEIYLVLVLAARGQLGPATELAQAVLASPGIEEEPRLRIGAHLQLALSYYYLGRYDDALTQNAEVMRIAQEVGDERALARAHLWRAGCLAMVGQADQALVEARQVAVAFDRLGTVAESAQGHLFLGNMLADNRSTTAIREEALAELDRTVQLATRARDPRRAGWAHYHAAELLRSERRLKEAADRARRALEMLGRIGDRSGEAVAHKIRGQIALDRGELDQADLDLREAYRLIQGLHNTLNEADIELRLAQLALARGDRPTALERSDELDRRQLPQIRPDLAEEFARLKSALRDETPAPATS